MPGSDGLRILDLSTMRGRSVGHRARAWFGTDVVKIEALGRAALDGPAVVHVRLDPKAGRKPQDHGG